VTRAQALRWGRGYRARVTTAHFPAEVLALVDERLRGRFCVDCSALKLTPPAGEPLEVDHLQPLSKGGDSHHLNLTWRCRSHNRARGNRDAPATPETTPLPAWKRRGRR